MSEPADTEVIEAGAERLDAKAGAEAADYQEAEAPSYEDRALTMGWTPKSQFRGDPDKWVDAETFVKRGEEFLPFLKANNRRLEQALERANTKMAELDRGLKTAIQQLSQSDKRAYAKARADLEAELHNAAQAGDVEAVKAINKDIVDLEKETVAKVEPEAPAASPDFEAFKDENDWYGKDKALSAAFDALCAEVYEEGYTKPKAGLKEAMSRLKEQFPAKFAKPENPNRRNAAAVEGSGTAIRSHAKTFSDLPAEAKAYCDELCRTMKGMTREKYVKDYFAQEEQK